MAAKTNLDSGLFIHPNESWNTRDRTWTALAPVYSMGPKGYSHTPITKHARTTKGLLKTKV